MTVNDGTGPRYDRPSRITRETVRRAAPVEPEYPEWDAYQALLADGMDDADARVAIWPDHALLYVAGEDGDDVLLPVGKDGFAIIPEGYEAPEGDEDDETGDDEAEDGADGSESADAPQTPDEPEIDAEAGADGAEADPEAQAEDDAAADEIADGDDKTPDAGFDPASGTVDEVRAYLADHPDQTEYVLERERGGKARVSLIGA
jgi:hypothetical protein